MSTRVYDSSLIIDTEKFNTVIQKLREFFLSKNFLEVHAQNRLSILAACEDYFIKEIVVKYNKEKKYFYEEEYVFSDKKKIHLDLNNNFCMSTKYNNDKQKKNPSSYWLNKKGYCEYGGKFFNRDGIQSDNKSLLSDTECKAACNSYKNCNESTSKATFTPVTFYPNLTDDYSKDCQDVCNLSDECNKVLSAIKTMGEKCQEVLMLASEGMSMQEMQEVTQVKSLGTVLSRLSNCRKELKGLLA